MRRDLVVRSLREVAAALDSLTSNWFLVGGSCLGFLRHGQPIDWDTDLDVGIFDPTLDIREVAKRLPVVWFSGVDTTITGAAVWLGVRIDVYRFFEYDGQVASAIYNHAQEEVKFLLYPHSILKAGMHRGMFCGVECNVLNKAHEYCRRIYTDSYMIPNPHYDYWRDAANAITPGGTGSAGQTATSAKPFWRWRPQGVVAAAFKYPDRLEPMLREVSWRLGRDRGLSYLVTKAVYRLLSRQAA